MDNNKISWTFASLVVLVTLAISFGPVSTQSTHENPKNQDTKTVHDLTKYPIVGYEAAEPSNLAEKEERREKSKRYDKKAFIIPNPRPDFTSSTIFDAEPIPPALPLKESKLVITGSILGAKGAMSNDKSAVYSEYTVQIESFLKQVQGKELQVGQLISVDRTGGRVRYANGATILYLNEWQDLPEMNERYLFFLDREEGKNPNFRIVTAYKLKDDQVMALDNVAKFRDYNGRKKSDFIKLVLETEQGQ